MSLYIPSSSACSETQGQSNHSLWGCFSGKPQRGEAVQELLPKKKEKKEEQRRREKYFHHYVNKKILKGHCNNTFLHLSGKEDRTLKIKHSMTPKELCRLQLRWSTLLNSMWKLKSLFAWAWVRIIDVLSLHGINTLCLRGVLQNMSHLSK